MSKKTVEQPRIVVYPGFNAFRYSFHVHALRSLFQEKDITYSVNEFPQFISHSLPFIFRGSSDVKIYISAGDGPGYDHSALEWCDMYAKRTLLDDQIPGNFASKIVPMGPHFGIRTWGLVTTIQKAIHTYFALTRHEMNFRDHLWYYFKQYYYRLPEKNYSPGQVKPGYVFYASTLYPTHPSYNRFRATFIEACLATPGVQFEGGLIRKDDFRVEEYRHITISKYYRPQQWLEKVKSSLLGFWAPGDQGAMTLKLGEFMACGKAIIAVPIRQEMLPSPLVHGEHVHFVNGSLEEMRAAVRLLTTNHEYRQKLERNARKYYEEWVAPAQAMRRFIREACQRVGIPADGV